MTEKKITKRERFTEIVGILSELGKEELVKVMEHEIELLDKKKASSTSKTSKNAEADKILADSLLVEMEKSVGYTITEMLNKLDCCKAYETKTGDILSNQRLSRIVTNLQKDGFITRTEKKGRAYFEVVAE